MPMNMESNRKMDTTLHFVLPLLKCGGEIPIRLFRVGKGRWTNIKNYNSLK
jgi:hypothetical protein